MKIGKSKHIFADYYLFILKNSVNDDVLIVGKDYEWFDRILILNDKLILRIVIFRLVVARFDVWELYGERMERV